MYLAQYLAIFAALAFAQARTAKAGDDSTGDQWPDPDDWRVAAAPDLDSDATAKLTAYAFSRQVRDDKKKGIRTDGLLVIKGGEIVYERYAEDRGFGPETPHISWSVSKSFLNAWIGTAVMQGRLSLTDAMERWVPSLNAKGEPAIQVHDALEMGTCLEWSETYEGIDFTQSSVLAMLYGAAHADMGRFVAGKARVCAPGSEWNYASGTSVLLALALKSVYGSEYADAPWTQLLEPIGAKHVTWERDQAGTFVGSSYLYAPPRDLARLGYLFLRDGIWKGRRLLPEGWVQYSATPAEAFRFAGYSADPKAGVGGAHWWTNAAIPEKGIAPSWPSAPSDTFAALGHWGQSIFVIPSADLVVVRVADDRDGSFSEDQFLSLVLAAVKHPARPSTSAPLETNAGAAEGPEKQKRASPHETPYWRIPGLSSAFVAKELCSCLFVSGLDEAHCRVYASQSPQFAEGRVDWTKKEVRAALRYVAADGFSLFPSVAHYIDVRNGCVLD